MITYSLTTRNDGDVSLTGIVLTLDSVQPIAPFDLAVGAQVTHAFTVTVTQAHLDAGSITVVAAVSNMPTTASDTENVVIVVAQNPTLATVAAADVATVAAVGDPVQFTVTATNTGNVTLSGLAVTAGALTLTCGTATLAPTAATTCTTTYLTTQADLDARRIRPTFVASATSPLPAGASVTSSASVTVNSGLAATGGTIDPVPLVLALGMMLLGGILVRTGHRGASPSNG